jgi:hypothetical protein
LRSILASNLGDNLVDGLDIDITNVAGDPYGYTGNLTGIIVLITLILAIIILLG